MTMNEEATPPLSIIEQSPYLEEGVIPLIAENEDLTAIPDPNLNGNMVGEVLPDDWSPEHGIG